MDIHPINYKLKSNSVDFKNESISNSFRKNFSLCSRPYMCIDSRHTLSIKKNIYKQSMKCKPSMFSLAEHSSERCGNPHVSILSDDPFQSPSSKTGKNYLNNLDVIHEDVCLETSSNIDELSSMNYNQKDKLINRADVNINSNEFRPEKPPRSPARRMYSTSLPITRVNIEKKIKDQNLSNAFEDNSLNKKMTLPNSNKNHFTSNATDDVKFNYTKFSQIKPVNQQKSFIEMFEKFENNSFGSTPLKKLMPKISYDFDLSEISIGHLLQNDVYIPVSNNIICGSIKQNIRKPLNNISKLNDNIENNNVNNSNSNSKNKFKKTYSSTSFIGLHRSSNYASKPGTIKPIGNSSRENVIKKKQEYILDFCKPSKQKQEITYDNENMNKENVVQIQMNIKESKVQDLIPRHNLNDEEANNTMVSGENVTRSNSILNSSHISTSSAELEKKDFHERIRKTLKKYDSISGKVKSYNSDCLYLNSYNEQINKSSLENFRKEMHFISDVPREGFYKSKFNVKDAYYLSTREDFSDSER